MKKQVLFTLAITAASALVMTGCATKQDVAESRARQEAIDMSVNESQDTTQTVSQEPAPTELPAIEPAAPVEPEPTPAAKTPAPKQELKKPAAPKAAEYTVTAGDAVSSIAVRFGVRQPDIIAMNPELRKDPNNLRIGQKILLPPGTDVSKKAKPRTAKPAAKSATPAKSADRDSAVKYKVQSGDVLGGIAYRYGVTVKAIKVANNLKKDTIFVGQTLTIPAPTKKPAANKTVKKWTPKAPAKTASAKKPAAEPAKKPAPAKKADPIPSVEILPPPPPVDQPTVAPAGNENLPPPPPVPAAPEAAKPAAPQTINYVVKPNEDLISVSLHWGVNVKELRAINGIDEAAGNDIAPGTTLKIPVAAE